MTQPHRTTIITGSSYAGLEAGSATVDAEIDGRTLAHKQFHHQPASS